MTRNETTGTQVLSGVVFVVAVAALVILELRGGSTTALMVLVGPVVSALFVTATINRKLEEKTAPLADAIQKVDEQTNGQLDRRFLAHGQTIVDNALSRAGVSTPEGPSTSTMPADFLGARASGADRP